MEKKRVILADDHTLIRSGLRSILGRSGRYEVVAEAGNGKEAVDLCRRHRPELVLMDIYMRDGDGLWATKVIKEELPDTAVIIVSVSDDKQYMIRAFEAGASAYLLKTARPEDLLRVMDYVTATGGFYCPLPMAPPPEDKEVDKLTAREREILTLAAGGATNAEMARRLGISPNTVKNHIKNILGKLGVKNRTEAVSRAIRAGILPAAAKHSPNELSDK